jgi:hypothetical protein
VRETLTTTWQNYRPNETFPNLIFKVCAFAVRRTVHHPANALAIVFESNQLDLIVPKLRLVSRQAI